MNRTNKISGLWLAVIAFTLALAIPFAWAAFQSIPYGGGKGESTLVYDEDTNTLNVPNLVGGAVATAAQVVAATDTIAADACGGMKRVSAAGAVTTNTTNTFTAPAAANAGCLMAVCNISSGANTITLDKNALFLSQGGADVALAQNTCVWVGSDGAIWRQASGLQTDS